MSAIGLELKKLKGKYLTGYWGNRILSELEYAYNLSSISNHQYDQLIESALHFIEGKCSLEKAISKDTALQTEKMITKLSAEAKRFKMICTAHAHIDMNWMWSWDETVAVTLDTFRTMLNLLEEYPDFKFSQSQAAVYRIVEQYAPEMLEEIKARVNEGRWEVTASHWVEADKNMPNGESLTRQILYTKKYLSKLLDIDPTSLNLDFEPDTFGHSVNVPEILTQGGIKYYYHCRGYDNHNLYKWEAPSGNQVIVYREPIWYNAEIEPSMALHVPAFCKRHQMDTMLKVYGVGDHGGGPTRRDIERIMDMNTWPVFPRMAFGTYHDYFRLVEQISHQLPTVKGELNFIFTGCYTSQSRIKMANRLGEATLNEAESFSSVSSLSTGTGYSQEHFARAWRNVLFNQFHDILPGSGVIDTREYSMGLFRETMAAANSSRSLAMRKIADQIDTSEWIVEAGNIKETVSEGAGVGFGIRDFKLLQAERGRGKTRIFHVFNPSWLERREAVEITIWDWHGEIDRIVFLDDQGHLVTHQLLDHGLNEYWGHQYIKVLLMVKGHAFGYQTYLMKESDETSMTPPNPFGDQPRVESVEDFVLENDRIRVTFDSRNAAIVSMIDKSSDEEMIDPERPAGIFRYIEEDDKKGMTSWRVGRYMNVEPLLDNVKIDKIHFQSTSIRQAIIYEIKFRESELTVTVSLDQGSDELRYQVECDWHEIGKRDQFVPQLNFYMPFAYECESYQYDVPFGTIERKQMDQDVPANSWALGKRKDPNKKSILIVTDSKYGFRGVNQAIAVDLLRSSYDPDPYPEFGIHRFKFAVCLKDVSSNQELVQHAYNYNHPLHVLSATAHEGTLPLTKSFASLEEGSVAISALKMPEERLDNNQWIIRVYETEGNQTKVRLKLFKKVASVHFVDINENKMKAKSRIDREDQQISFDVSANSVASLCITF